MQRNIGKRTLLSHTPDNQPNFCPVTKKTNSTCVVCNTSQNIYAELNFKEGSNIKFCSKQCFSKYLKQ